MPYLDNPIGREEHIGGLQLHEINSIVSFSELARHAHFCKGYICERNYTFDK